jgi:hypothetical protein
MKKIALMLALAACLPAQADVVCRDNSGEFISSTTCPAGSRKVGAVQSSPSGLYTAEPSSNRYVVPSPEAEVQESPARPLGGADLSKVCEFKAGKRDPKGRELAIAAKQECLQNGGLPGLAYTLWKDHREAISAKRGSTCLRTSSMTLSCR